MNFRMFNPRKILDNKPPGKNNKKNSFNLTVLINSIFIVTEEWTEWCSINQFSLHQKIKEYLHLELEV